MYSHAYLNMKEHIISGGQEDISLIVSNVDGSDTIGSLKVKTILTSARFIYLIYRNHLVYLFKYE